MRTRSTRLRGLVAIAAVSVLGLSACGTSGGGDKPAQTSVGFAECETKPNECNSGPKKAGGTLTVITEKKIQNWNVADSDGNTLDTGQIMNAILPIPFVALPNNTRGWNKDLFSEEPKVTSESPQTMQYKIKKEAVWNDGTPITYKDFQMHWKWSNGRDCPDCSPPDTTGYESIESIEGADGDKTAIVKFKAGEVYPDWRALFQIFPAHIGATKGDLNTPAGLLAAYDFFKETPTWSGGAYKFSRYEKDNFVELVPNEKWWGDQVRLDKITFKILEDQAQHVAAMRNNEVQMLVSQPNGDMVTQVAQLPGVNYNLMAGPQWEQFMLNLKNPTLADLELRRAMFTVTNRQEIIDKTVGIFFKKAAPLGNHSIMPGSPGYVDNVTPTGQGQGKLDEAKKILTDAGYTITDGKLMKGGQAVPPIRFRYTNGNTLRQQTGEIWQNQLKQIGIELKIEPTASLGGTLSTGDFDAIIFAWVGNPEISQARQLWRTGQDSNYAGWSNPEADALFDEAAKTLDDTKVRELLNKADALMAKDSFDLPLFQKPAFLAVYNTYVNIRNNATASGQTYNIQEWGLKA
jgi:peptide/nickel transport system substrate-binding protein